MKILGQPGRYIIALGFKSGDQSIPNNTETKVTWTVNADSDPHGVWAGAGDPGDFIVPTGFTYARVTASIKWAANAVGYRANRHYYNNAFAGPAGMTAFEIAASALNGANVFVPLNGGRMKVVGGDHLGVAVVQTSGAALNVLTDVDCWINVELWDTR